MGNRIFSHNLNSKTSVGNDNVLTADSQMFREGITQLGNPPPPPHVQTHLRPSSVDVAIDDVPPITPSEANPPSFDRRVLGSPVGRRISSFNSTRRSVLHSVASNRIPFVPLDDYTTREPTLPVVIVQPTDPNRRFLPDQVPSYLDGFLQWSRPRILPQSSSPDQNSSSLPDDPCTDLLINIDGEPAAAVLINNNNNNNDSFPASIRRRLTDTLLQSLRLNPQTSLACLAFFGVLSSLLPSHLIMAPWISFFIIIGVLAVLRFRLSFLSSW